MMHRWVTLLVLVGLFSGCVTETVKTTSVPTLSTDETALASDEILDVAIAIFNPGIADADISDSIYPEIRRAEASCAHEKGPHAPCQIPPELRRNTRKAVDDQAN